jgi:hypothetical protein
MSVINGQVADQTTFNNAFLSRTTNSSTVAKVSLLNPTTDPITSIQDVANELMEVAGITEGDANRLIYGSNNVLVDGQNHKQNLENIDAAFDAGAGHDHSGVGGSGAPISAANLANFNPLFADWETIQLAGINAQSTDVSLDFAGKTSGGDSVTAGVITSAPFNRVQILDLSLSPIEDAGGQRVYGRISELAGVWTLDLFTSESGVETAHTPSGPITINTYFLEVFTQETRPTISNNPAQFAALDVTADVVDASSTQRGVVSTGAQSFAGNKTFTGTVAASNLSGTNSGDVTIGALQASAVADGASLVGQSIRLHEATSTTAGVMSAGTQSIAGNKTFTGTIAASNLSGTNTGNVTVGAVQAASTANAFSLSGQQIRLHPADGTNAGLLTAVAQAIGGLKTFNAGAVITTLMQLSQANDAASTGSMVVPAANIVNVVTNASLTEVTGLNSVATTQIKILINATGADINVKDTNSGASSIRTGTGADVTLKNNGAFFFVYDTNKTRWQLVGGTGSGGGAAGPTVGSFTGLVSNNALSINTAVADQVYTFEASSGQADLNIVPFGSTAPTINGSVIELIGNSDANPVSITYNDAAKGCIGNFSNLIHYKGSVSKWRYISALDRWVLCFKNF